MVNSFCAAANLRTLVKSERCPNIVRSCAPILEECYGQDQRGTLMNDIRTFDSTLNEHPTSKEAIWDYDRKKFDRLESAVYDALVSFSRSHDVEGWTPDTHALLHKQHKIRGAQYAELNAGGKNTGGRNSIIFFQPAPGAPPVPGVIRKIFSMPRKQQDIEMQAVFIAVQRYQPLAKSEGIQDPFARYENFGAALWSEELGTVEIITPSQPICHGVLRNWQKGVCVLRPLDRVGYLLLFTFKRPSSLTSSWAGLLTYSCTTLRRQVVGSWSDLMASQPLALGLPRATEFHCAEYKRAKELGLWDTLYCFLSQYDDLDKMGLTQSHPSSGDTAKK
jgi:hypothetical protein